ncbi:MAG: hypothetical protein NC226_03010, partial [Bacteroides cellulosilyticus]|nr:hypothetical protein [Bacteroides cellulosilyticus]
MISLHFPPCRSLRYRVSTAAESRFKVNENFGNKKFVLSLLRSQTGFAPLFRFSGVPGFDSRQSLIVSTPSA